ncbi:hypothetical protein FB451DRAFT_1191337 [Mycena latifolia]|nr:hypothetical protein FB451DRAFT_1191337 [Mycena latifolia]
MNTKPKHTTGDKLTTTQSGLTAERSWEFELRIKSPTASASFFPTTITAKLESLARGIRFASCASNHGSLLLNREAEGKATSGRAGGGAHAQTQGAHTRARAQDAPRTCISPGATPPCSSRPALFPLALHTHLFLVYSLACGRIVGVWAPPAPSSAPQSCGRRDAEEQEKGIGTPCACEAAGRLIVVTTHSHPHSSSSRARRCACCTSSPPRRWLSRPAPNSVLQQYRVVAAVLQSHLAPYSGANTNGHWNPRRSASPREREREERPEERRDARCEDDRRADEQKEDWWERV